jgi:LacI family transcriptional regulator
MALDRIHLYSPPAELRDFARDMASRPEPPDGYVCGSEGKALALLSGLRDAGAAIGSDVDVVPKETTDLFDYIHPSMTGLHEDFTHAGAMLARLLMRRIDGSDSAEDLQVLNNTVMRLRSAAVPG